MVDVSFESDISPALYQTPQKKDKDRESMEVESPEPSKRKRDSEDGGSEKKKKKVSLDLSVWWLDGRLMGWFVMGDRSSRVLTVGPARIHNYTFIQKKKDKSSD